MLTISMVYSRHDFFRRVRDDLLRGAFQEYMCREISLKIGKPDFWTNEVTRLLSKLRDVMDTTKTATTFKDRNKALSEAFREMYGAYDRINSAKSKVLAYPGYGEHLHVTHS